MSECGAALDMNIPGGKVRLLCVIQSGHDSPHQGLWSEGSRADQPGAVCPSCRGRGTLEKYVMNGRVIIQWERE